LYKAAVARKTRNLNMNPAPQKIALITGAARRLGRAIALGMAADGWDIVVHYRASRDEALGYCR
jgi:NAD(P)-dependent dehydrogenase (short-subunit alcohol dehydrogenase family)